MINENHDNGTYVEYVKYPSAFMSESDVFDSVASQATGTELDEFDSVASASERNYDEGEDEHDRRKLKQVPVAPYYNEYGAARSRPPPPPPLPPCLSHSQDDSVDESVDDSADLSSHPKAPATEEEHSDGYDDGDAFDIPSQTQFEALWQARSELIQRNLARQQEIRRLERLAQETNIYKVTADDVTEVAYLSGEEAAVPSDKGDKDGGPPASPCSAQLARIKKDVDWHTEQLGQDHPLTLSYMTQMAELQRETGNLTEAAKTYRIVCDEREKLLPEHSETWRVLSDFGLLQLHRAGSVPNPDFLEEAEVLLRKAYHGYSYGGDDESRWKAQHNLGIVLTKTGGERTSGVEMAHSVLVRGTVLFGADSVLTLDAMLHCAVLCLKVSDTETAEQLIDCWRENYDRSASSAASWEESGHCRWMRVAGSVYLRQGRVDKAHELFERAFTVSEHAREAVALLVFLRKVAMWDKIEPLVDKFASMKHADFSSGAMLRWCDAVVRAATGALHAAPANAPLAERLYRKAQEGYKRLHTMQYKCVTDRRAIQNLLERRSLNMLQKFGDCCAMQATTDDAWLEAEGFWRRAVTAATEDIRVAEGANDPVYRAVYALCYRLATRGEKEEAADHFYRLILTPILDRRLRRRQMRHAGETVEQTCCCEQQVGDIIRGVELIDMDKSEDVLKFIISDNLELCGQTPCCSARSLLLLALSIVAQDEETSEYVTDMLSEEGYHEDHKPITPEATPCDAPWMAEVQKNAAVARLAKKLHQFHLREKERDEEGSTAMEDCGESRSEECEWEVRDKDGDGREEYEWEAIPEEHARVEPRGTRGKGPCKSQSVTCDPLVPRPQDDVVGKDCDGQPQGEEHLKIRVEEARVPRAEARFPDGPPSLSFNPKKR